MINIKSTKKAEIKVKPRFFLICQHFNLSPF